MKKSANLRLDHVRRSNQSPAAALCLESLKKAKNVVQLEKKTSSIRTIDKVCDNVSIEVVGVDNSNYNNSQLANCICSREPATLRCTSCGMFTYGRVVEHCPSHRNITFLMDFIYCPNCLGPKECLEGIELNARSCQIINNHIIRTMRNAAKKPQESEHAF